MARKYHPDKNKAPGATEAFKKIGTASSVLSDSVKRRRYDQYGTVGDGAPAVTRQRQGDGVYYQFDGHHGFDGNFINDIYDLMINNFLIFLIIQPLLISCLHYQNCDDHMIEVL